MLLKDCSLTVGGGFENLHSWKIIINEYMIYNSEHKLDNPPHLTDAHINCICIRFLTYKSIKFELKTNHSAILKDGKKK